MMGSKTFMKQFDRPILQPLSLSTSIGKILAKHPPSDMTMKTERAGTNNGLQQLTFSEAGVLLNGKSAAMLGDANCWAWRGTWYALEVGSAIDKYHWQLHKHFESTLPS
jgi:hypothetical protein